MRREGRGKRPTEREGGAGEDKGGDRAAPPALLNLRPFASPHSFLSQSLTTFSHHLSPRPHVCPLLLVLVGGGGGGGDADSVGAAAALGPVIPRLPPGSAPPPPPRPPFSP